MANKQPKTDNPFGAYELGSTGMYVLPKQRCTEHRRGYFIRARDILGTYSSIANFSSLGLQWAEQQAAMGLYNDETPMSAQINDMVMQGKYGTIRNLFDSALPSFINYIAVMIYGNFEAFLVDSICAALSAQGHSDPEDGTLALMTQSKWSRKIDRISNSLGLDLGKRKRRQKFADLDMDFMGTVYQDPIDYLQVMAETRHLIVHYGSRLTSKFIQAHSNITLTEGDRFSIPAHIPFRMHLFFVKLTELIDGAFAAKFGWPQVMVEPAQPDV